MAAADPTSPMPPVTPFGGSSFGAAMDIAVAWDDIKFKAGEREILKGLTGTALPRRTLAVMGSSGAGKTTFLNAISDRLAADNKHTVLSGNMYLNNVEYHHHYRRTIGFVTQDDILNPMSTPTEALNFSLRIRRGVDSDESEKRVEQMLDELGLTQARDTIVGIPGMVAGLSGGERKRTNIGVELITAPKVLLLDEPTSGLDSVTAAKVCNLLKKLATRGRTVIFTIHQPTSDCLEAFDDLMLMSQGKVVYHGKMTEAVDYFAGVGYPCPDTFTPTDFFMTLMQDEDISPILIEKWDEYLQAETERRQREPDALPNLYVGVPSKENKEVTENYLKDYTKDASSGLGTEFAMLMDRAWKSVVRNKMFIGATFIQNIVFALIAGLIFIRLEDNVTGVSDRIGLLFMIVANTAFSSVMGMVNNFPPEKAVFIRDQQSGAYSPTLYFITKSLAELPTYIAATFLQVVIVYWMAGLVAGAKNFFLFYAITLMMQQVGAGIGLMISSAIDSYVVASGMTPLILIPLMVCAGLFSSTDRLRPYWYWLEKPSFMRAGFLLMAHNEFGDLGDIDCNVGDAAFCARQPQNGPQVLGAYEWDDGHAEIWLQWLILAIFFVLSRVACVAFLYKIARTKN